MGAADCIDSGAEQRARTTGAAILAAAQSGAYVRVGRGVSDYTRERIVGVLHSGSVAHYARRPLRGMRGRSAGR